MSKIDPGGRELAFAKRTCEGSAIIGARFQFHKKGACDRRRIEFHARLDVLLRARVDGHEFLDLGQAHLPHILAALVALEPIDDPLQRGGQIELRPPAQNVRALWRHRASRMYSPVARYSCRVPN